MELKSEELRKRFRDEVLSRADLSKNLDDIEVLDIIDQVIMDRGLEENLTVAEKNILRKEIFNSIRRLDILQELIEDKSITEIMVNGSDNIFIEVEGRLERWNKKFESSEKLEDIIQQIVAKANRIVNEATPIVDARLEDGSRVNVVLPPVALDGPVVTIRKFPEKPLTMKMLIEIGAITFEVSEFLNKLVLSGYNIFISGGTGSGKTTFLNILSSFIPEDERIITIEDSAELQIRNIPNLVRLEARNANVEGNNEICIRDLIKSALRMRPDRIIVGEVRDAAAIDMLAALNTGHDGSLSTGHANSPRDMLSRLEALVLQGMDIPLSAIRKQIASALDIIIHLGRLRDKSRKVLEIVEVLDCEDGEIMTNTLYKFIEKGEDNGKVEGELTRSSAVIQNIQKLSKAGIIL